MDFTKALDPQLFKGLMILKKWTPTDPNLETQRAFWDEKGKKWKNNLLTLWGRFEILQRFKTLNFLSKTWRFEVKAK